MLCVYVYIEYAPFQGDSSLFVLDYNQKGEMYLLNKSKASHPSTAKNGYLSMSPNGSIVGNGPKNNQALWIMIQPQPSRARGGVLPPPPPRANSRSNIVAIEEFSNPMQINQSPATTSRSKSRPVPDWNADEHEWKTFLQPPEGISFLTETELESSLNLYHSHKLDKLLYR